MIILTMLNLSSANAFNLVTFEILSFGKGLRSSSFLAIIQALTSSEFSALFPVIFVAFVEDNATMSSIRYSENCVSYFVQNRRK